MTNNSVSRQDTFKIGMMIFLSVQAIRQLVLVNGQFADNKESRAGQVSTWFVIALTLIVAGFMYPASLSSNAIKGGLTALFIGIMGSGIAMVYDVIKNKAGPEKNRLWFGIAHIVFALAVLAYLMNLLIQ